MRIILLLFALLGVLIGLMFIIANNTNLFLQVLGVLISVQSTVLLLDVLFFKRFEISKTEIRKVWLFGEISVPIGEIDYAYRSSYKINRGRIVFQYKKKNFFLYHLITIHLLGVSNYQQTIQEIKKVFIKLNIIKGDEYEWNY
jgi:purine-cytosine permease-like protein